jgi:DNA-binding PadR family transcriptional regulator
MIKPMSPYEVKNFMQRNTSYFWAEKEGQLYPTFKLLTEAGHVKFKEIPAQKSGTKKIYSITPSGKALFSKWFASKTEPSTERNPALLKLFFARTQPIKNIRRVLEEMHEKYLEYIELYEIFEEVTKKEKEEGIDNRFYKMTLDLGLASCKTHEAWCRDCLKQLDQWE